MAAGAYCQGQLVARAQAGLVTRCARRVAVAAQLLVEKEHLAQRCFGRIGRRARVQRRDAMFDQYLAQGVVEINDV